MKKIAKPTDWEYAQYYEPFVAKVNADVSVLQQLKANLKLVQTLLENTPESLLFGSYEVGKWNIKDILQHLIDFERVFVYRAMRFARNDKTAIPFFDEKVFAKVANASTIPTKKLFKEFKTTRLATISFFENQNASSLKKTGIASNSSMSVRATAWIICGHELHHLKLIAEKYVLK
jgi:hypothetical protein